VIRRGAAATPDNACARVLEGQRVFGEVIGVGGVHHAPAGHLRPARVGHHRDPRAGHGLPHQLHDAQKLRGAAAAVHADDIHAMLAQPPRDLGRGIAQGCAIVAGEGHLRDDGDVRIDRARGLDRFGDGVQIGERLEQERVHARADQRGHLDVKGVKCLVGGEAPERRQPRAQRADRPGDVYRAIGRGAGCPAGELDPRAVDFGALFFQVAGGQFGDIGAEGVGFDQLRPGLDVGAVNALDHLRMRDVEQIEASVHRQVFASVEHGAHRSVRQDGALRQPLTKRESLHMLPLGVGQLFGARDPHAVIFRVGMVDHDRRCGLLRD